VCAKEAATSDDEPFPIGTRFVIETHRSTRRFLCRTSVSREVEQEHARVLVMKKYATVQWRGDGAPKNEAWACALFDGGMAKPDIARRILGGRDSGVELRRPHRGVPVGEIARVYASPSLLYVVPMRLKSLP